MFAQVHRLLKPEARFCLVVGYNKTNIGQPQIIDTPLLLSEEAKKQGFQVEEIVPLETYQRYGLHAKQAITGEALIILKA
jgi:site-specific DNA-methyltransferase (cytosine-N4-specific)